MTEVWKDVVGYEGYYQVSNFGRIRSVDRYVDDSRNGKRLLRGGIRKATAGKNGYLSARFCMNNKPKMIMLHRVVASAFIPNPDNLPEVNHKDEDITNNCVDNLEWCTSKYNANYGTRNKKLSMLHKKAVNQLDLGGNLIKRWDSGREASKHFGIDPTGIMRVCKGRKESYKGYKWEYAQ